MFKRIVALFLFSLIVISSFATTASAVDSAILVKLIDYAFEQDVIGHAVNGFSSLLKSDTCGTSPNGKHDFQKQNTMFNGESGVFYMCQYCGRASADVFSEAYTQYTDQMQTDLGSATLINGGVRVYFKSSGFSAGYADKQSVTEIGNALMAFSLWTNRENAGTYFKLCDFTVPFACNYTYGMSFTTSNCSPSWSYCGNSGSFGSGSSTNVRLGYLYFPNPLDGFYTASGYAYADLFPVSGAISDQTTVNITNNSRPTILTGDIGYYNEGELQVIEDQTIVNEAENTVTDPVTGESKEIESWVYDYIKRMYEILTTDGEKTTVTYGDEYITYETGDKTYNFYYVDADASGSGSVDIGGDGSDISGFLNWWKNEWLEFRTWLARTFAGSSYDPDHTHEYKSTVVSDSTCITSGLTLFTCSCGDSYEERSDVLPHDYEFYQTIPATYDEQGNVVTDAYDMYVCSMCNRISRVPVDTQPSEETEDNQEKSLLGSFGLLRDLLSFFWNGFNGFIGDGIGKFITTSGDSSNDVFSILGEVDWSG